jgi:nucleotide-binding universal stress UspA family protein
VSGARTRGRVVVGVDGSPGSRQALDWAVRETRLRGTVLHVVVAWQHPQSYAGNIWGLGLDPSFDVEVAGAAAGEAARLTREAVAEVNVTTTSAAVEGHPARVLLDEVSPEDLLVVGSRGRGGFVGALIGSVSQHLVAHATCPVVVVPTRP